MENMHVHNEFVSYFSGCLQNVLPTALLNVTGMSLYRHSVCCVPVSCKANGVSSISGDRRVNKQRPYLLLYLVTHLHIRNVCTLCIVNDVT